MYAAKRRGKGALVSYGEPIVDALTTEPSSP
jgi:hypothetical protein